MNIIITGASRGIGFELAKQFAQNTKIQLFLISRNKIKLNDLSLEIKTLFPKSNIQIVPFDLENTSDISKLVELIKNKAQHIDVLVNNAGLLINKPFKQLSPSEAERMYKVNLLAPMELIRCLLPLLEKAKNSHVVNISSMGGFQGSVKFPGLVGYASSKAAIAGLTECLAEEYKDTSIKFNCLALGAVATEMLAEAFPGYEAPTTAFEMARYIHDFALNGHYMFNGKILPVSKSTP